MSLSVAPAFALALVTGCAGVRASTPCEPPANVQLWVDSSLREIRGAHVWSVTNRNDKFRAWIYGSNCAWNHNATLWIGENAVPIHSGGGQDGTCYFELDLDRSAAVQLAASLGVALNERKDPGHRLSGTFEVIEGASSAERTPVRFHLRNVGPVPIRFLARSELNNSRSRDKRFEFDIHRGAERIETVELPRGGMEAVALYPLKPGEEHVFDIDLSQWAHLDKEGTYAVRGRYRIEIRSEASWGGSEPYPAHDHERWNDAVEASFQITVAE